MSLPVPLLGLSKMDLLQMVDALRNKDLQAKDAEPNMSTNARRKVLYLSKKSLTDVGFESRATVCQHENFTCQKSC